MGQTKIFIDPTSRILYASFYIKGLNQVFGKENVSFSAKHFKDLERNAHDFSFEHYFAFMVEKPGEKDLKIIIDFCDPPDIHPIAYAWCDRYAKINFNKRKTGREHFDKLIPIPPGFGIKIWDSLETVYFCGNKLFEKQKTSYNR